MDVDVVGVAVDDHGPADRRRRCASVPLDDGRRRRASPSSPPAGTTNFGIVDDLASGSPTSAASAASGSTSTAPTAAPAWPRPACATAFAGIEHADSFIVDPHKWLFAPFDCCALLYRDPALARAAHTQHADYLDVLNDDAGEWNPSDYAVNLTRRARGLPFWFSLATHGTDAYRDAVERTLAVARVAAEEIGAPRLLELLREPDCRSSCSGAIGWTPRSTSDWSDRLLRANFAFVHADRRTTGETVTRFAIVNPRTTRGGRLGILDTMAPVSSMLGGMIEPVAAFGNHLPVRIRFGEGVAASLPDMLAGDGLSRPFLLLDRGLDGIPAIAGVIGAVDVGRRYEKAPGEPTDGQVDDGAAAAAGGGRRRHRRDRRRLGDGHREDERASASTTAGHTAVAARRPGVPGAGAAAGADPDHGRHRIRGLGRCGDHQRGDAHQGGHRLAEPAWAARAGRPRADLRAAADADPRRRRRRARAGRRRDRRYGAHPDRQRHRARGDPSWRPRRCPAVCADGSNHEARRFSTRSACVSLMERPSS